jgi:hypothetical protein
LKSKGISLSEQLNKAFDASESTNENEALGIKQTVQEPIKQTVQEPIKQTFPKSVEVPQKPAKVDFDNRFNQPQPLQENYANVIDNTISEDNIKKVIDVFTAYSNLDPTVKQTLALVFLKNSNPIPAKVVYTVLNSSRTDIRALEDLVILRKYDGVNRAFELMSMDNDRLEKLHKYVDMFVKEYNQKNEIRENKVQYCRQLEHGISLISEKALDHLGPISELLKLGRG